MANWFIGFPVDTAGWFGPLIATAPPALRRFHPHDVHITVAFLGACGEGRAEAAWDALPARCGGPMPVTLGALRAFGNPRRPSALSLTLAEGHEEVAARMGALRPALWEAAGARPDTRDPLPHLTVARPPRRAGKDERARALGWIDTAPRVEASLVLDRIALYGWSADRSRQLFEVIASRPLAS